MKQTAVEWLVEQLKNGKEFNENLINQAKEMEKEQIIEAYHEGTFATDEKITAEEYYNETFKQETLTYTETAKKEERIFNSTMMSKQKTFKSE